MLQVEIAKPAPLTEIAPTAEATNAGPDQDTFIGGPGDSGTATKA